MTARRAAGSFKEVSFPEQSGSSPPLKAADEQRTIWNGVPANVTGNGTGLTTVTRGPPEFPGCAKAARGAGHVETTAASTNNDSRVMRFRVVPDMVPP